VLPPDDTPSWNPASVKRPSLEKRDKDVPVSSPSPEGYFHPNSEPPPDINIDSGDTAIRNGDNLV